MGTDFIFANTNVLKDGFYCEDKIVQRYFKNKSKIKILREQALNYWKIYSLILNTYSTCRHSSNEALVNPNVISYRKLHSDSTVFG